MDKYRRYEQVKTSIMYNDGSEEEVLSARHNSITLFAHLHRPK